MLALKNDEDKTREGKWKHFVIAKSFRGFKCYTEGWETLTFGIASAEPSVVAPTCASCFPAIVCSLKEELAKHGQEPALHKCWNTQQGLAAGQFCLWSIIFDFEKEDYIKIVDMGQKDRCVSGVWESGVMAAVLAFERVAMGLCHAGCISLNINSENRWHKGRARWLHREWKPEISFFFMPKAQQCEPHAPWPTPQYSFLFFFFFTTFPPLRKTLIVYSNSFTHTNIEFFFVREGSGGDAETMSHSGS